MKPQVGDVYSAPINTELTGALRILKHINKDYLIYISSYMDKNIPKISDNALTKCLMEVRFNRQPKPVRMWLSGLPTKDFTFVGNIALTELEKSIQCSMTSGNSWNLSIFRTAYFEWKWARDPQGLEEELKEIQKQDKVHLLGIESVNHPKYMLSIEEFWNCIKLLDWSKTGDDSKVVEPLVRKLTGKNKKDIFGFEERLSYLLFELDTNAHARYIGEHAFKNAENFSADIFLYARCAVVANGKAFYDSVVNRPNKMPKDVEFEKLLTVASDAYMRKYQEEMDYDSYYKYETYSNTQGWNK